MRHACHRPLPLPCRHRRTRGSSPVKFPVLTALKWAFGRSLGASTVAALFSSFLMSCTTCCYCCYCCCGSCSPAAGQHELDGIKVGRARRCERCAACSHVLPRWWCGPSSTAQIKWQHDKPIRWYTVNKMVDLDWTRTVQGLPGMIQAYVAVTGHDFVTAARHVHSMLMCQDMWLWCAYICEYMGMVCAGCGAAVAPLTLCVRPPARPRPPVPRVGSHADIRAAVPLRKLWLCRWLLAKQRVRSHLRQRLPPCSP